MKLPTEHKPTFPDLSTKYIVEYTRNLKVEKFLVVISN